MLHVRSAQWEELPFLASIGVQAFEEDPCYQHFYPFRKLFPEDWRSSFLRRLQNALADPSQYLFVAQRVDAGDPTRYNPEDVIGFGLLKRQGPGAAALKAWNPPKPDVPPEFVKTGDSRVQVKDRSVDEATIQRFYDEEVAILGGPGITVLECTTLAVLPGQQRSGVGKALLEFGFDQSEQVGLRMTADASAKGINLYLRMGMSIVGNIRLPNKTAQAVDADGRSVVVQLPEVNMPIIHYIPKSMSRAKSQLESCIRSA
ncbi:acyl- N-acyltransferase [Lecanosticta acicola]|uniref:Acyl- N-acyltransferase n=1 Tax=Lecanosticta acicola TaxID=111012 RepID=A0AAI8W156_9PEZI|nr:acyl- N-acyltransferase [Lecanosticta acicola]